MSSRIFRDDPGAAGPMVWRRIAPFETAPGAEAASDSEACAAALRQEYDQRIQAARASGFAEGETAGRRKAVAEIQPVLERLARAIEEIAGLRARLRREAEADMLRLALAIARRVLRREMAIDADAMHGLVLGALEKLQGQEVSRVRVHPSHVAQLRSWLKAGPGAPAIDVIADSAREPGDVIFETGRGDLDASVDSQLQEIERGLADRLRRNS